MGNIQNTMEFSKISGKLADHITSLADITKSIGDETSTYILRNMEPRMRQGLVRVAVIGVTSTGKSTAINGLVNTLALPENPSVSTPIPVWIGYQDEQGSKATIYRKADDGMETLTCDLPTFKRKYCYNIDDIIKKDRTRYDNVAFGAVNTNSPLLKNGVVLIDTLGISATTVDSRKTIRVLKEGVDAVIFLTKNTNLSIAEKRFLYNYVLGCSSEGLPEGEEPLRAVLPENLFIVHNDWEGNVSEVAFKASVRKLYSDSGLDMDADEIKELVKEKVFFINAYKARLGSLGVYPYESCAPEGSSAAAIAGMKKREQAEKDTLAAGDRVQMLNESGIAGLAEAIMQKGEQLCRGGNSAAVRRINELVEVVDGVISASDERLGNINITITDLNNKKQEFKKIEADNKTDRTNIVNAITALKGEYAKGFNNLITAIAPDMGTACVKMLTERPMPEDFAAQYQAYRRMDNGQREAYLQSLLPEVIEDITRCCTEKLFEALDSSSVMTQKTPFAVMAEVEQVISNQEITLNSYVDILRELGAERLGAAMPRSIVINKLFGELKQDLAERIKAIIGGACKLHGDAFQTTMQQYVKHCRLNLFQRILGNMLPDAEERLWEKITLELFFPLVEKVVVGMTLDTVKSILEKTETAFNEAMVGICESHARLFVSVDRAIEELEKQGGSYAAWQEKEKEFAEKLRKECNRIKDDIQAMSYQLAQG